MAETTIVLVGHCGFDAPRLEREIGRCCPSFEVLTINSVEELEEVVEREPDLLLVNRQLPYGFETEEGVELISELHKEHPELKMMLVSDRPDAQEEAREAGALAGFGKADLGSDRMAAALREALVGQRPA